MSIKQVIVVRRDLNMRKGKVGAQCSHAAMAFLTREIQIFAPLEISKLSRPDSVGLVTIGVRKVALQWMLNSFAKVVVKVEDLAELMQIRDNALKAGLEVHLIVDNGRTEFHGESTPTCIAIGPDYEERLDPITGHLTLY